MYVVGDANLSIASLACVQKEPRFSEDLESVIPTVDPHQSALRSRTIVRQIVPHDKELVDLLAGVRRYRGERIMSANQDPLCISLEFPNILEVEVVQTRDDGLAYRAL